MDPARTARSSLHRSLSLAGVAGRAAFRFSNQFEQLEHISIRITPVRRFGLAEEDEGWAMKRHVVINESLVDTFDVGDLPAKVRDAVIADGIACILGLWCRMRKFK